MRPPRTWKSPSGWIPLISSTMWHWRMHTQDPAEMTTRAASGKSLSSWPGRAIRGARVSRALEISLALPALVYAASPPAGPTACATCHPAQAQSQPKTAMGNAIELPPDQENLKAHPKLTFEKNGYAYTIERQGDLSTYTVRDGAGELSLPIQYAFGVRVFWGSDRAESRQGLVPMGGVEGGFCLLEEAVVVGRFGSGLLEEALALGRFHGLPERQRGGGQRGGHDDQET